MLVITRETIEESSFNKDESIIMISDPTNEFGKKLNLPYVAMDEIKKIYKTLEIEDEVEGYFDTTQLNVPGTFILTEKEGRIIYKYAKRDFSKRAPGGELLDTLIKLRDKKR